MTTRIASPTLTIDEYNRNIISPILNVYSNHHFDERKNSNLSNQLNSPGSDESVMTLTAKGSVRRVASVQNSTGTRMEDEIQVLKPNGWKWVKGNMRKVIEYGHREGLLTTDAANQGIQLASNAILQNDDAENLEKNDKHDDDVVKITTRDLSLIHAAIPFLPVPVAVLCFVLNILAPGIGTVLSGICAVCMGQPRINFKEGRRFMTLLVNILVGIAQLGTITFLLVGWFWSMAWGGLLLTHSLQYRQALIQHRQEAVATAAIEALTRDAILRRRDVRTLVQERRQGQGGSERRRSLFTRFAGKTSKSTVINEMTPGRPPNGAAAA